MRIVLQAVKISELSSLKLIFPVLANAIGAKCPKIVFDDFVEEMKNLEERYTFWNDINQCLTVFSEMYPNLFEGVKTQDMIIDLEETEIKELKNALNLLIQKDYLMIRRTGTGGLYIDKLVYGTEIKVTDEYRELFQNKECVFYESKH